MDVNRNRPQPTPERIDEALLDRYLAGECTPEERARVEGWSASRGENDSLLRALREATTPGAADRVDVDAAWVRVAARLPGLDARAGSRPRGPDRTATLRGLRRLPAPLLRAAALLVLGLGVVGVWRSLGGPDSGPGQAAMDDHVAPVGSPRVVTLADGSEVTLSPTSRLRAPRDPAGRRDVTLEGEAFFRVAHDAARPFRVLADGNAVTVLGTEFDVRTARAGEALRVVVSSGRVSVGRMDREPAAVLEAGQMAVLAADGVARVGAADLERALAWTRGRIEMDDLPLTDALSELERWYDVELEVDDPTLARRRVSATFRGEPVEQVLESLTLALDARVEREGRVYRLVPDGGGR